MEKGFKVYFTKQKLTMCYSLQCFIEAAQRPNKQRPCLNSTILLSFHRVLSDLHNICEFFNRITLPDGKYIEVSGSSERVVFSSPASGKLSPPSNIPNTLTVYLVPALWARKLEDFIAIWQRNHWRKKNSLMTHLSSSSTTVLSKGPTRSSPRSMSSPTGWNWTL